MPGLFLNLEIDDFGMSAVILEKGFREAVAKENCRILFEDLPADDENEDIFTKGLAFIAEQIDLSMCSAAVVFIPSSKVYFRQIDFPFKSIQKIKQVLSFELEPHLPHENTKYIHDFHVLDIAKDPYAVFSGSILGTYIRSIFDACAQFGIKPAVVAPSGYAAAVSLLQIKNEADPFVFIDIKENEYTLVLVYNRQPMIVRSFPSTLLSPDKIFSSIIQTTTGFRQRTQIQTGFNVFVSCRKETDKARQIQTALEGVPEFEKRFQSADDGLPKVLTLEQQDSSQLLSSITPEIGMKYFFNFCKGEYAATDFLKRNVKSIAASLTIGIIVFMLAVFSVRVDVGQLKKDVKAIDNEMVQIFKKTFPKKKKIYDPYLQLKADVLQKSKKARDTKGDKDVNQVKDVQAIEVLFELSTTIPSRVDIEFSRLNLNKGRLLISGSTDDYNNVDKIKSSLESSALFKKVDISSATSDKKDRRIHFKFQIEI
ncbi:MAG: hypothetical protein GY729_12105 [Desulfobacteraceae bacterium]|nr:hypothetical protein [Desulfobacteraceae bacterium]